MILVMFLQDMHSELKMQTFENYCKILARFGFFHMNFAKFAFEIH